MKRDLAAGRIDIDGLLREPPAYLVTAKTLDLLLALPTYDQADAERILEDCGISVYQTVGGLSDHQRNALLSYLHS